MNAFLILGFFTTITNTLFRDVPDWLRYILVFAFMGAGLFCFAKCIRKKDDKHPINFSYFILGVLFVALSLCYILIK